MAASLDPREVASRLNALRSLHVAESIESARARLAHERPSETSTFDLAAARALAELRALCDLADYLHRAR